MNYPRIGIIGAGPAGLAAAAAVISKGHDCILFEMGKQLEERKHNTAQDLGIGIGGAGLFSDGKFSFYPSGTALYRLRDSEKLEEAYGWVCKRLNAVGISTSPFPKRHTAKKAELATAKKDYPSYYGTLEQRHELIASMVPPTSKLHVEYCRVTKIVSAGRGYIVQAEQNGTIHDFPVSGLILATGRLGNLELDSQCKIMDLPQDKLRFEFGLRIESPSSIGFLNAEKNPDVKMIWNRKGIEIRTFCTCRKGEIWNIPYENLAAVSGRSDGPPTSYSNFGLLARFAGENYERGKAIWDQVIQSWPIQSGKVIFQGLPEFLARESSGKPIDVATRPWFPATNFVHGRIADVIGEDLHGVFTEAIEALLEYSPSLLDERSACMFPAIEGTGAYPRTNGQLQVEGQNIWCAGDLAGKFRGIIPAMVSGYYAGINAAQSF
jgi:uncharacterized protein